MAKKMAIRLKTEKKDQKYMHREIMVITLYFQKMIIYIKMYISYFWKYYLHLRVRGGEVEDSKSIDSASEPCNKKTMKLLKLIDYFLQASRVSTENVHTLSSSPSLSH